MCQVRWWWVTIENKMMWWRKNDETYIQQMFDTGTPGQKNLLSWTIQSRIRHSHATDKVHCLMLPSPLWTDILKNATISYCIVASTLYRSWFHYLHWENSTPVYLNHKCHLSSPWGWDPAKRRWDKVAVASCTRSPSLFSIIVQTSIITHSIDK